MSHSSSNSSLNLYFSSMSSSFLRSSALCLFLLLMNERKFSSSSDHKLICEWENNEAFYRIFFGWKIVQTLKYAYACTPHGIIKKIHIASCH